MRVDNGGDVIEGGYIIIEYSRGSTCHKHISGTCHEGLHMMREYM